MSSFQCTIMSLLFALNVRFSCFVFVFWTFDQTSQTFPLLGLNSPHEQWRRENGQRYCLATMAKDTDCPGWMR